MISTKPKDDQSIQYPSRTLERAERAMRCSPFAMHLFAAMRSKSISLQAIAGEAGIQQQYTRHRLSELAAENALSWLIQVGVLRREVDGQGITDSFRLTPLGRQLVDKSQRQGVYLFVPSWGDRIYNALARWFRLPIL